MAQGSERSSIVAAIILAVALVSPAARAAIIHVPGDQPTIQAGIDAAVNGDEVVVADGVYTGDGNRDMSFGGKAITVRSENGAGACIIDLQADENDPHRAFNFENDETAASVLEGFTIRSGFMKTGVLRALDATMEKCSLESVANRLIRHLSKGYRQRVGLAQALIHDPPVLILDEPTLGLDPRQTLEIRNLINDLAEDRTVILSTHILPEVTQICNKLVIINEGKLVLEQDLKELTREATLEEVFIRSTSEVTEKPLAS